MREDERWMRLALSLAARTLGRVWPNPAVGCVLVANGVVVGRGWTQPSGRPHAETEALGRAGAAAVGATAIVSLEPCDHQGVTGPCSKALIAAGVARVVVALEDPDPRVQGRGIARLRDSGIVVETGVLAAEAAELNRGFFLRVQDGRPLLTLKLATSLDGRIATAGGDSRWITGPAARAEAHRLRASHDAVLIGAETALADDPALTCRLPGCARASPVRVVADGRLRLPVGAALVRSARETPAWVLTRADADPQRRAALSAQGVQVIDVACGSDGRLDPCAMAQALAARGLTRVLIEGGGVLAAAFLGAGIVDRLAWFHAPRLLGGDARPAAGPLRVERVADAPAFLLQCTHPIGDDILATYTSRSTDGAANG